MKFSGLAFQFIGVIGIFAWLGWAADAHFKLTFPLFLIISVLVSFSGMMYKLYRDLKN